MIQGKHLAMLELKNKNTNSKAHTLSHNLDEPRLHVFGSKFAKMQIDNRTVLSRRAIKVSDDVPEKKQESKIEREILRRTGRSNMNIVT